MTARNAHRRRPTLEAVEPRALLATLRPAIAVETPLAPYVVNPRGPASLDIYISSIRLAGNKSFQPFTDIDRGNVKVNGVIYQNVTIRRDAVDRNGDGLRDAILTISPRKALKLADGDDTLTVRGRTTRGIDLWVGQAPIVVTEGLGSPEGTSVLPAGRQLDFSDPSRFSNALISANEQYIVILQNTDGNLAVYGFDPVARRPIATNPLWTAGIGGKGAVRLAMKADDGNLVAYNAAGGVVWQSRTASPANAGAVALLTDTGRFRVARNGFVLFTT